MRSLLVLVCASVMVLTVWAVQPPKPWGAVPTQGQLDHLEKEIISIVHFGPNTYTGQEWGYGDVAAARFNPTQLDTNQWVAAAHLGEIKGMVLVAKHHDGFCLWPTKGSHYSVASSPWKGGRGNLVSDFVRACRRQKMAVGFYISPWDRNHADYGRPAYVTYYHQQWRDLMMRYGQLFEIWFDGANGGDGYYGGARESRSISKDYYRYDDLMASLKRLHPKAVAFGSGRPGAVRWPGNEGGYTTETNWGAVIPKSHTGAARDRPSPAGTIWMHDEADTPFRNRWFWHPDDKPKALSLLVKRYFESVGRNAVLNLGLAPDRSGRICEVDVARLKAFGDYVRLFNQSDILAGSTITATNTRGNSPRFAAKRTLDTLRKSYWAADDGVLQATLTISLPEARTFDTIDLREAIALGQRIKAWQCQIKQGDRWQTIAKGSTIGNRRIVTIDPVQAKEVRIQILDAFASPTLAQISLKHRPALSTKDDEIIVPERPVLLRYKGSKQAVKMPMVCQFPAVTPFLSVTYVPHTEGIAKPNLITHYQLETSQDGKRWFIQARGEFSNIIANPIPQKITLPDIKQAKWIRLKAVRTATCEATLTSCELIVR